MPTLYYNLQQSAVELRNGLWTLEWGRWMQLLFSQVDSLTTTVSGVIGVNTKTYTECNALGLGASDEGYLAFEPNFGHLLRWSGSAWAFAAGDVGNGFFRDFAIAPQEVGWALCDGAATTYLTLGATLSATAFTTPDLRGYYKRGAAAYTGSQVAAALTGNTGAAGAHDHGGATGSESSHTHDWSFSASVTADGVSVPQYVSSGGQPFHIEASGTTTSGTAHSHSISSQADHTHSGGTLAAEPAHVDVLPYFRR